MKSARACEAFNANYEVHGYGPTLNLAMYLNVALAIPNCDFAEVMVPQNVLSIGMVAQDLPKVDDRGYVAAPTKPGPATKSTSTRWRTQPSSDSDDTPCSQT
jgi:enolase-like protein